MPSTRRFFVVALSVVIGATLLSGVCMANSPNREVVVMFRPGGVRLPTGSIGCRLDEATVSPVGLESVLHSVSPDSILSAVPTFNRADTVRVGREGQVIQALD